MSKGETSRTVLITGGAGFIGSNLAQRLLNEPNTTVRVFDNLSRAGVERNVAWLKSLPHAARLEFVRGDVRDAAAVSAAARDATDIFHLAAQVAVTTSVDNPLADFQVNAAGTLNVLEAARASTHKPFVLYTSTNKVYGALHGVPVRVEKSRYSAVDANFTGVDESEPLDFHSPYGCSKGSADQYVRDYARIYNLPTVVFRMSCIAGPRQFGNEDQGWVAHFLYSVLSGKPITIYGDGCQVRDVLHVYDLIDAMLLARSRQKVTAGEVYNLGGGPARSTSVLELLQAIEKRTGIAPRLRHAAVRPGDQPLYISGTAKLERDTGWRPRRSLHDTLDAIYAFWQENAEVISSRFSPHSNAPEAALAGSAA